MVDKDPGNAPPEEWTGDEAEDPTVEGGRSEASGVVAGSGLNRPDVDTDPAEVDPNPDRRAVVDESGEIDADDDAAVLQALADGRRDLIDPSRMSLQRRMQFGLLTREDDEARVRGELGNHMTTGEGAEIRGVGRTNIYDDKAGSEGRE